MSSHGSEPTTSTVEGQFASVPEFLLSLSLVSTERCASSPKKEGQVE